MSIRNLVALVTLLLSASPARGQALQGIALFEQYCASCHAAPAAGSRAPDRQMLSERTPEAILDAITTGSMAVNATGMNPAQRRILAEHLTLRPLGAATAGTAASMKNQCAPKAFSISPRFGNPIWSGWSPDSTNARFQGTEAAGLTAAQVPGLTLKWAFAFPNGTSAFGQPAVAGGRVFVGSDNGFVYSLDAASGCVYWSYAAGAGVRTAVSVGEMGSRYVVYFGDLKGVVHAIDAETAAVVWTKRPDPHPLARITGAPTLVAERLYVPVASLEEASGANPVYECCTFRGSLVAYDARNGNELWRAYTIADPPKQTRKTSVGTQLWGPAGAAVWSAPTVDIRRAAIYVATGDAYNLPAADTSDAIMAFDLATGKRLWVRQITANDAYLVNCGATAGTRENCPAVSGPDFDFGNSPILRQLNGRRVLVVGQKSGIVTALDPDAEGSILWQKRVGRGSALGGLEWGSAADAEIGYFPNSDAQFGPAQAGGLFALRLLDGEQVWEAKPPGADCPPGTRNCTASRSAAISVIPGAVFSGTTDGMMRAYSTTDGRVLWEYNTAREFPTVNGVTGKGGSINGPGPVVAGGMMFTNSGYSYLGQGGSGNVLLAFGPP